MALTSSRWTVSRSPSPLSSTKAAVTSACSEAPGPGSASSASATISSPSPRRPAMFTPTNAALVSRRLRSASIGLSSAARVSAVTAPTGSPRLQHLPRGGLEHLRNPLIRLDARLGQMPRLPLRLVCPHAGQGAMCFATLLCRRQLDNRGAGQGMAKDQPASLRIDVQQPASLGGRQVPQLGVSGCPLQRPPGRPCRPARRAGAGAVSRAATPRHAMRTARSAGR